MTIQSHGPTTVPALLGRALEDERSLTLTSAPAHVIRHDTPDGTQFALVIDAPLSRRALMDLLYVLAPYKAHGPDRFARVLDNWGLHDRAMTSDTSARLMHEHARSLKSHWQEFTHHRDGVVDVLRDAQEAHRVVPVLAWSTSAQGKREWLSEIPRGDLFDAVTGAVRKQAQLDSLVGLVTVPYFLPELHKRWRAWQPLVKGGKSNYIGPASVPVVALMHRRAILNSTLIVCTEAFAGGAGAGS